MGAHIRDPVPVGMSGCAANWASAVCGGMGALTPGTFEKQELIRGGGLSCGPAQLHVMVFWAEATPCRRPAGVGEVAHVLTVEADWGARYEFGSVREAAAEGDVLVDTFVCDHWIREMQDYRCWHAGAVGCSAVTRSQELSSLQCLWPHDNVSIVFDDEGREVFPILISKQSEFSGDPVHDDGVGLLDVMELIRQLREPDINRVHHPVTPGLRLHGDPYVATSVTSNHPYIRCVRDHSCVSF